MPRRRAIIDPLWGGPAAAGDLLPWVRDYVRREELLTPGDRVLVAVSAGPDSVALLHLLYRLRQELDLALWVAHFDHGLRGAASRQDAAFVAQLAEDLGLPCRLGEGPVRELARTAKISLQMAARRLRLHFLQETRQTGGYTKLALGHTADDQVELFFLRLLRGAGPEGLKGMWPATPEGLVRPLLAVGKDALLAWLEREALPYRQDRSNLSRQYLRNRIRLDLLPELIGQYNPRLKGAVWRAQTWLQEEARLLTPETARVWDTVGERPAPDFFIMNLTRLAALSHDWQKRLLRATLGKLRQAPEITAPQVESLLALAWGEKSGGVISLGDIRVARAGPELHFFPHLPAPAPGAYAILPPPPGQGDTPEGWRWQLNSRPLPPPGLPPASPFTARFDQAQVAFPLKVRYFQAGDRFWPLGAPGTKKLQDFLMDRKAPRWLRPQIPLVESAGQIIWVAGLRIAEPVKLTPATRTVMELTLSPQTPATRLITALLGRIADRR